LSFVIGCSIVFVMLPMALVGALGLGGDAVIRAGVVPGSVLNGA
jgi:hypothetical protein